MKQEDYLQTLYYSNKMLFMSVLSRMFSNHLILFLFFLYPIIALTFTYMAFNSDLPVRGLLIALEAWLLAIVILFMIYAMKAKRRVSLYRDERETRLRIKSRP